jgi:hypothetical protein
MKTIRKYQIKITGEQEITMPFGAEVIHAGLDPQGTPCLWAKVESGNSPEPVSVLMVGTGNQMPYEADRHLGSFTQGDYVWHVFLG